MSLMEGDKLVFVKPFSDFYYDMDIYVHVVSPIKFSEMVDSSVFYSPLYIFPHPGLSTGGEKGGGGSRGKQHGGRIQRRRVSPCWRYYKKC